MADKIPIKTMWLLMFYASKLFKVTHQTGRFDTAKKPDDLPNMVAEILICEVNIRLRYGLNAELKRRQDDLTRVRGRIDHIRTMQRRLIQRGRIACKFDEFTIDTPKNRFVKAALHKVSQDVTELGLKRRCHKTAVALGKAGVSRIDMRTNRFGSGRVPNFTSESNPEDKKMLAAAELAFSMEILGKEPGSSYLSIPDNNYKLEKLFEEAIRNFYKVVLAPEWEQSSSRRHKWPIEMSSARISEILPGMENDIIMERSEAGKQSRIIIDTKFADIIKVDKRYNNDKRMLDSKHIFQIYSYLRSRERKDDPLSYTTHGMLLYRSFGETVNEWTTIHGHKICFATVDLTADNAHIRKQLLDLIPQ